MSSTENTGHLTSLELTEARGWIRDAYGYPTAQLSNAQITGIVSREYAGGIAQFKSDVAVLTEMTVNHPGSCGGEFCADGTCEVCISEISSLIDGNPWRSSHTDESSQEN